ncbi:MAG: hypothetical protein PVH87_23535 [Desulfobacteraceae bacterium]|jgi:hypothetical protein
MIAREWKCKCTNTNKENFIEYLYKTGVDEASKTSGFLGVQIFLRDTQGKSDQSTGCRQAVPVTGAFGSEAMG